MSSPEGASDLVTSWSRDSRASLKRDFVDEEIDQYRMRLHIERVA